MREELKTMSKPLSFSRLRRIPLSGLLALLISPLVSVAAAPSPGQHPLTGRTFAWPMGVAGAGWLERPERVRDEQPDKALDYIGIEPGSSVADIGAGSGYFTARLARRVGPTGKVYANDIQQGKLLTALKRGGRLVLLEYRAEDPRVPILNEHKMTREQVQVEIEAAGYKLDRVDERLPRQHLFVFIRP